jgi:glycosyltransferase involved in cell wall biosynthesis
MHIVYERISEPGLVSARNRAMSLALAFHPEFLAFIDDDEVPEADWLSNLIRRVEETGADFASGPIVPEYTAPPPRWATEGEFFHASRDSFRTSNLILCASCLPENESQWFQHEFNFSGGEVNEFLGRLVANGAAHVVAETGNKNKRSGNITHRHKPALPNNLSQFCGEIDVSFRSIQGNKKF